MKFVRRRLDEPSINITPLIDVVFILLIFFMVSTRFVDEQDLALELPSAGASSMAAQSPALVVDITDDGRYRIDGASVSAAELVASMRALHAQYPQRSLRLRADSDARHGVVVRAMDAATQAGFARVDIATRSH